MTKPKYCPCHSNKLYRDCCKPYHEGAVPENALVLMRSRYSAYALHLSDYIINTTHPDHPSFQRNTARWREEILDFCKNTRFESLEILDFTPDTQGATVTFIAHLKQGARDASFREKSRFIKVDGHWLYESGVLERKE